MRSNSGGGKGGSNNRDPTLRDKERGKGVSGEAIHGGKKADAEPGRTKSRGEQSGG